MITTLKLEDEFISICQDILKENLDVEGWKMVESSDQFQTNNYCGGFDGVENEFTFSYYDNVRNEFWFQISLDDIGKVEKGIITEVEIRKAG